MRPTLETLGSRILADAALATAFITEMAPAVLRQVQLTQERAHAEIATVLQMAYGQAAALGPQFAAQNLPQLVSAANDWLSAEAPVPLAVASLLEANYNVLFQLPPIPNELMIIGATVMTMQQLDAQLST